MKLSTVDARGVVNQPHFVSPGQDPRGDRRWRRSRFRLCRACAGAGGVAVGRHRRTTQHDIGRSDQLGRHGLRHGLLSRRGGVLRPRRLGLVAEPPAAKPRDRPCRPGARRPCVVRAVCDGRRVDQQGVDHRIGRQRHDQYHAADGAIRHWRLILHGGRGGAAGLRATSSHARRQVRFEVLAWSRKPVLCSGASRPDRHRISRSFVAFASDGGAGIHDPTAAASGFVGKFRRPGR